MRLSYDTLFMLANAGDSEAKWALRILDERSACPPRIYYGSTTADRSEGALFAV